MKRIVCIFALLQFSIFLFGSDIHIQSSNGSDCEFQLELEGAHWDTLLQDNQTYHRFQFTSSGISGEPGEPMLPCREVIVALPPDASVQVNASAPAFEEIPNVRLLPCPRLVKSGEFAEEVYEEGPGYQESGFVPQSLIQVSEPGNMGDLRVVHVRIFPIQFDAVQQRARIYSRVTVHVQFLGGASQPTRISTLENTGWIDQIILNADMAKNWLQRPRFVRKYQTTFGSGPWYKIPVTEEHIYKITGKQLKDKGIDLSALDLSTLKLYNNGGQMLPREITKSRQESLIEIPIRVEDNGDGRLDENDAVLFHGKGVEGWTYNGNSGSYSHYLHLYDTKNIYWLTFNDGKAGKRIVQKPIQDGSTAETVTRTPEVYIYEQDKINPIHAGIRWYSAEFSDAVKELSYDIQFENPVSTDTLLIEVQVKGWGDQDNPNSNGHNFKFQLNSTQLEPFSFNGFSLITKQMMVPVSSLPENSKFVIKYNGSLKNTLAYLDWFTVKYQRLLEARSDFLKFSSPEQPGRYKYQLSGFGSQPVIWDITDPGETSALSSVQNGNVWQCVDPVQEKAMKKYVAFRTQGAVPVSEIIQDETVSDLRNPANSADMIIIAPQAFFEQAERLKQMRETEDTLQTDVVDIQDVYDEFSWGQVDPTAIRDFMVATRTWLKRPAYLLLFGDATYQYKNIEERDLINWIPTYEVDNGSEDSASAVDGWFGRIVGNDSDMDMAVGRLPVQTEEEAKQMVDKIINYETDHNFGLWRSAVTLLSDDVRGAPPSLWETTHTDASETLANSIVPPYMNIQKVYLTEYEEVIQADGRRKPAAKDALFEKLNMGTAILNYIGHGNEGVWAHEQVLVQPGDLDRFQNTNMLPLFFGATCTFARFDFADVQSLAENIFLRTDGGGIACIGASRSCNSGPNEALDRSFLKLLLNGSPRPRVGEALRLAFNINSDVSNNEKYNLLGDPALRLALPDNVLDVSEINPDSLKALTVTHVQARLDSASPDFDGQAVILAFDSEKKRTYYNVDNHNQKFYYQLPGNVLFHGLASVDQGKIQASFIVPKDISYGQKKGRISLYASNDVTDAAGYKNNIPVGGSSLISDNEGPDIVLSFTENPNFVTGGLISSDPELLAELEDKKTGINITGEIGHKLTLTVDDQEAQDVSGYFKYDQDSYLKGKLQYPLSGLEEGTHDLTLKAWDNANNSSTTSLVFQIVPRGELRLQDVLNYPNPFSSFTQFTFQVSHSSEVEIKIFTIDGRMIRRITGIFTEPGFNMVAWDGRDEVGDALSNGVYLYKVEARADVDGKTRKVSEMNRLMVYR